MLGTRLTLPTDKRAWGCQLLHISHLRYAVPFGLMRRTAIRPTKRLCMACVILQASYTRGQPRRLALVALRGPIRKCGGRDEGSCCLLSIAPWLSSFQATHSVDHRSANYASNASSAADGRMAKRSRIWPCDYSSVTCNGPARRRGGGGREQWQGRHAQVETDRVWPRMGR